MTATIIYLRDGIIQIIPDCIVSYANIITLLRELDLRFECLKTSIFVTDPTYELIKDKIT